ncbi:MAG: hypothetical protein IPM96_04375 [Ignavibacteria bacterium]|nr:hypothetical protein [Ignavibacteria bacterium]
MKTKLLFICFTLIFTAILFNGCSEKEKESAEVQKNLHGGYESQVKWGEHLVMIGGCNDCHTPKKMSPKGPCSGYGTDYVRTSCSAASA